jgi:hypothetical protein
MLDLNNVEDLRDLLHETCQHLPPDETARRTHVAVAILEGARGGLSVHDLKVKARQALSEHKPHL